MITELQSGEAKIHKKDSVIIDKYTNEKRFNIKIYEV